MADRSWMLNPAAIGAAKKCINLVEEELGIKLKLSHPEFLSMIGEYAELTESGALSQAFEELAVFAGNQAPVLSKVVQMPLAERSQAAGDTVEYKGKEYPRYDEQGREFKGLYRGSARYA